MARCLARDAGAAGAAGAYPPPHDRELPRAAARRTCDIRVAGPLGGPVGFCVLKADELYALFVAPEARGSSVAAALIADAEARLRERGLETAWLACAIGNARAARFYEKSGWRLAGAVVNPAETSSGPFPMELWRYEKRLTRASWAQRRF